MTLISIHHSSRYILLRLFPYLLSVAFCAYQATGPYIIWTLAYFLICGATLCRYISLASTIYLFTHDMLIINRGFLFPAVDCRSLPQLKGMQVSSNGLLRLIGISHLSCGLEGPPAKRIRITGISDRSLLQVLNQLNKGIERNFNIWKQHFQNHAS